MTNSNDHFQEYNRARENERRADIAWNKNHSPSRQQHKEWKATREQRREQRQVERAEKEPIHLKSGEPFQQQMSQRAASRTGMANRGGLETHKAEEQRHAARRQTVGERMGRVVRPSEEPDEHRHDRGPKL